MKEIKAKLKFKKILNNIVRDSPNATIDDEATSAELTQEGLLRLEKEAKIDIGIDGARFSAYLSN